MTDVLTQLCSELAVLTDELVAAQGEVEHRDTRLAEVWELTSTGLVGCEKNSLADQVTTDVDAIVGVFGKETTDWTDLSDVKALAEEAVERVPVAADALRRYMIRQGLPADPVRLDDPDLWALYEALSDS